LPDPKKTVGAVRRNFSETEEYDIAAPTGTGTLLIKRNFSQYRIQIHIS
jgi:hypothetical protein